MFTCAQTAGLKIWIVDDDANLRLVVGRLVSDAGYEAVEFSDGADALQRWASDRPALIVLDVNMERLDGWSTLTALSSPC
jgi:CheY-like chemotaxis protein